MKNAVGEFQRILLLGGRSDIGSAIAARLSTQFTKQVVLAGRNMTPGDVDSFRRLLDIKGLDSTEIVTREFDAARPSTHVSFVEELGPETPDLVIVAFGQLGEQDELRGSPVDVADLVMINMAGVVSSCLALAPRLVAQGSGHILFLSSVAGVRARKSNFVYGSTKAGTDAFAQGLADDLVDKGIGVTIVRPGFVHSAMTRGREAAPFAVSVEDVASKVADGMRRGSAIIWVPGILRYVFAVMRILPTFVWRRLPIK